MDLARLAQGQGERLLNRLAVLRRAMISVEAMRNRPMLGVSVSADLDRAVRDAAARAGLPVARLAELALRRGLEVLATSPVIPPIAPVEPRT